MSVLTSPTLQKLLTDVRILLNQRDPNNSFWKDDELTTYLNDAISIYFLEAQSADEGYFTTSVPLDLVANVETVALPVDCYKVKNLYRKVGNDYYPLQYLNNLTEGYSVQEGNSSGNYIPSYGFQGNNLLLRNPPGFDETAGLRLEYIQFPDTMIWGGDTMTSQVSPIFKQLITMYAVYKAKLKESMMNGVSVHSIPEDNVAMLYKQFRDTIAPRSKTPTYVIPYHPEG